MLPTPENYAIYPSVVPVGKAVKMTILATERAFLPVENAEYELTVIEIDSYTDRYKDPVTNRNLSVKAHNGAIEFELVFHSEQEHEILLSKDSTPLASFHLFALEEDLYNTTPLKADLHSHSFRSDGTRDPSVAAGHYREQAYDCFALTDHNRFYPGDEIDETFTGVDMEFFRIRGEEVHTPPSIVHIVHIGGKSSVAERYLRDLEGYEREVEEYLSRVPESIPEVYADRYARVMWATDKIHEAGGLAIFAHPFWLPGASRMNNVCSDFSKILLRSGMFDAYELIGGMTHTGNNLSVALWNDLRAEGIKIPVVGSSDVHKYEKSIHFPYNFTICFAKERTQEAFIEAIGQGNCVAVKARGTEYEREHDCYGNLRYVTYAQFLLRYFFRKMERFCVGEGVAMRSYAMGEVEKEYVECQSEQSRLFRARFFGKEPPVYPTKEILEFEERHRKIHLNGPITKGSRIVSDKVTRQI